jgi:hypothetical protein
VLSLEFARKKISVLTPPKEKAAIAAFLLGVPSMFDSLEVLVSRRRGVQFGWRTRPVRKLASYDPKGHAVGEASRERCSKARTERSGQ